MSPDLSLCLVTDEAQCAAAGRTLVGTVAAAVAGGVTMVQVRDKDAATRDLLDTVLRVADCLPATVPLMVNDRVDVYLAARALGADVAGVHLGQDDLPAGVARDLIGPEALIGLSTAAPGEIEDACGGTPVVDYLGVGALHATGSKADAPPPLGLDGLARLAALSTLPVLAIGGVTASDLPRLHRDGVAGVAVVSAICAAADARQAAEELARAWGHQ